MNIILISNKSAQAKNIVLTNTHLVLAAISLVTVSIILAMGINYLTLLYGDKINGRISSLFVASQQQDGEINAHAHLHDNLDVLAI
ncbi:MAG: M23 family peptidase, partial [Nitrosomonas sp.]|nr:M23 family peptidase [Nitrosomonas sp.]